MHILIACLLCFSTLSAEKMAGEYQVYFSPDDHVASRLVELIDKEEKSIRAAVYCLYHRGVAQALIDAKKRGVDVEVIVDPFSTKSRSPIHRMAKAGVPVYVWYPLNGQKKRPLMHDKFCVFGGHTVWTGSFNFTFEADRANQENAIVLKGDRVAYRYAKQYETIKRSGCLTYARYREIQPLRKKSA